MIKLPSYTTIEIKEFTLKPKYSGDIFSEYTEFQKAIEQQEKTIHNYCVSKVGEKYITLDYPQRTQIKHQDGIISYIRVAIVYYSHDYAQRILVSKNEIYESTTTIFQIAKK